MAALILILGGTRSGKSAFGQQLAEREKGDLLYLATATVGDEEMARRVDAHRRSRGSRWATLEEPLDLAGALPAAARNRGAVLVDCVTLWLSNQFFAHRQRPEPVHAEVEALIAAARDLAPPLLLVSSEVGLGIVPDNPLARAFRDLAGETNQRLARAADQVWLVTAGLPLQLK